ncbi:hypothetical protein [Mycobacterium sp.]|uniref:hypothetical protein n=1 Tax=Mycobacterium sp. TaxID=1785 RepID=UPI003C736EFC
MRTLTKLGTFAVAATLVTSAGMALAVDTAAASPSGSGVTTVPLRGAPKNCDFTPVGTSPVVPFVSLGTGSALIHTAGSSVVADIQLVLTNEPGMHFDVGLIQVPRPASATCGPGAPGTAYTGLDINDAGVGTVTIQDTIKQGTTGVWVRISRPNPHSQDAAESSTSEFVAPV